MSLKAIGLEVVIGAFIVLASLKCLCRRGVPEYLSGVCIAGAYFVGTSTSSLFGFAGNNPARGLPLAVIFAKFANIPIYLLVPFAGALIGLALFHVLDFEKRKADSQYYADNEMVAPTKAQVPVASARTVGSKFKEEK